MSITSRLGLAFTVMILLTLGVGGLGLLRMRDLSITTRQLAVDRFGTVQRAQRAVGLINENARVALHLFLVADAAELDRQMSGQRQTTLEISDLYAELKQEMVTPDEQRLFGEVLSARSSYLMYRSSAEAALSAGEPKQARERFEREVLPELDKYIGAWDAVLALEGRLMQEAAENAERSYERARVVTIGLVLIVAGIATLFAVLTVHRVSGPILDITRAAERLQKGDALARVALPSGRNDELSVLSRAFNSMSEAVAFRQERLKREMSLAQEIQTAILPKNPRATTLDLSAAMKTATEVGGDYYDVLPTRDGCWIGMGDVAGHGLDAGLVMLMIQASVAALVGENPDIAPRLAIAQVNRVLYENLSERLGRSSHATIVLLRFRDDGVVSYAGAHEEVLVCRAKTGRVEILETHGAWVGGVRDIEAATSDETLQLEEGDVLVLFTDGVTEARNGEGVMFGVDRLCAALESVREEPVDRIREHVFDAVAAWTPRVDDDMSVVIARRRSGHPQTRGPASARAPSS